MQLAVFLFGLLFVSLGSSRTILWTGMGGNSLWNNAGNWDCQCLPTIDDDVVIDAQAVAVNVMVGGVVAPALCSSLTVGGSSKYLQKLTLTGPINVGKGTSTLHPGAAILLSAGPDAPFKNDGTFNVHGNGFVFATGALGGTGTFVFSQDSIFNLTDAADKLISTNIVVNGKMVTHSPKSSSITLKGGNVKVAGSFTSASALSISADATSSFIVQGSLSFSGPTLLLQGAGFNFGNWAVSGQSSVTITNGITSGSLNIAAGGTVTLIGSASEKRTFDKIVGSGTIQNQGGNNWFNNLACGTFSGVGGNATIQSGTINSLVLTGAFLGGVKVSASSATLSGGFFQGGLQFQASNLELKGSVSISGDGTVLSVGQSGSVTATSILTLNGGSNFLVTPAATLKQSSSLQVNQGPPSAKAPAFVNNGAVISSASLVVFGISFTGTGSYTVNPSTTWSLTNVAFSAKSVANNGAVTFSSGNFNVPSVTGTGAFSGNPNAFNVNSFTSGTFTLSAGSASVGNFTLNTLTVQNGGSLVVGSVGKTGTFNFLGGKVTGANAAQQSTISSSVSVFKGTAAQTLTNVALQSGSLSLECASGNCQLFTTNASLRSTKQ